MANGDKVSTAVVGNAALTIVYVNVLRLPHLPTTSSPCIIEAAADTADQQWIVVYFLSAIHQHHDQVSGSCNDSQAAQQESSLVTSR
jgi:hypothetical protein